MTARLLAILVLYDGSLRSFAIGLAVASIATIPSNLVTQQRYFGITARHFLATDAALAQWCGAQLIEQLSRDLR